MTCTCFSVKALVFCSEANTKQKHKVGLHIGGWNLLRLDDLVQVGSQVPQCFLHVTKNQPFFIRSKHSWHQSKAHGKTRYMSSKLGDDTLVDSRFWRRSTASCNNSRACLSSFFHFCFRNKKSPFGTCDFSQLLTKSRKKFGTCHTLRPSTDGKWIHLFFLTEPLRENPKGKGDSHDVVVRAGESGWRSKTDNENHNLQLSPVKSHEVGRQAQGKDKISGDCFKKKGWKISTYYNDIIYVFPSKQGFHFCNQPPWACSFLVALLVWHVSRLPAREKLQRGGVLIASLLGFPAEFSQIIWW